MITVPDYWLTFLISIALPMLVTLVTKQLAKKWFQGLILALLSAATGVGMSVQQAGGSFEWRAALTGFFISFITAAGINYGLLEPAKITGSTGMIAKKVPNGIGPIRDEPDMPRDTASLEAWHEKSHSHHPASVG